MAPGRFHAVDVGAPEIEEFAVSAVDIEHKGGRTYGRAGRGRARVAGLPARPRTRGRGLPGAEALPAGVDVLVHDAQFLEGERPMADDYGHATVEDCVELGRALRGRDRSCSSTTHRFAATRRWTRSERGRPPSPRMSPVAVAAEGMALDVARPV